VYTILLYSDQKKYYGYRTMSLEAAINS